MEESATASAGKLHLLDLAQLKARLGDKWQRLSTHVEKFFEAAIRRALGPGDTFSRLDELSYLVLLPALSPEEAQVKCAAISEEVCQRLFGETGTQAAIRNLVARIDLKALSAGATANEALNALLEKEGVETIVSRKQDGYKPGASADSTLVLRFANMDDGLHRVNPGKIEYLYRPVWDVAKQVVVTYLCQPTLRSAAPSNEISGGFCVANNERDQAALDQLVLMECAAHTRQLRRDGFRILTAVPIGFTTVSRSRLWSAYLEAHRKVSREIARDLAYMVIGIDRGTPNIRLVQELPRLASITPHVFCAVDDGETASGRLARTGARAMGIALSHDDPEIYSIQRIRKLGQEAQETNLDAFVLGFQSTSLALNAIGAGIRYLEGPAIRSASADPQHGFAQSLEYLYQSKLAPPSSAPAA